LLRLPEFFLSCWPTSRLIFCGINFLKGGKKYKKSAQYINKSSKICIKMGEITNGPSLFQEEALNA